LNIFLNPKVSQQCILSLAPWITKNGSFGTANTLHIISNNSDY